MVFKDRESSAAIRKCRDVREVKALGRNVKDFDKAIWDKLKVDCAVDGNYAKFMQSPELREFLLNTGGSVLINASPTDRFWGTGASEKDLLKQPAPLWPGNNLLGYVLMEVRSFIRSGNEPTY